MADDRSPRRRKRTFSTTSTISTDDYQDASEQIVEDISLEFFYKPRSITALACLFVYLVYSAFTRWGFLLAHVIFFWAGCFVIIFLRNIHLDLNFSQFKKKLWIFNTVFLCSDSKKIKWDSKSSFGWLSHNFTVLWMSWPHLYAFLLHSVGISLAEQSLLISACFNECIL